MVWLRLRRILANYLFRKCFAFTIFNINSEVKEQCKYTWKGLHPPLNLSTIQWDNEQPIGCTNTCTHYYQANHHPYFQNRFLNINYPKWFENVCKIILRTTGNAYIRIQGGPFLVDFKLTGAYFVQSQRHFVFIHIYFRHAHNICVRFLANGGLEWNGWRVNVFACKCDTFTRTHTHMLRRPPSFSVQYHHQQQHHHRHYFIWKTC